MKRILFLSFRAKMPVRLGPRNLLLFVFAFLAASCRETSTTLRFVNNREAVAAYNWAKPKAGDNVEGLINTEKKIYFIYPRGDFEFHFNSSLNVKPGERKLFAAFSTGPSSVRISVLKLARLLPITGPPNAQNRELICREESIAQMIAGRRTEIVTLGNGNWIRTMDSEKITFVRPIDPDLVVLVEAVASPHAPQLVATLGSKTFEHGR